MALAEHVPRVNKERCAEVVGGLPEGLERLVVEVPAIHMGADLGAGVAGTHGPLELARGGIGRLQRHGREACKAARKAGHEVGDVVVEEHREVERLGGLLVVGEHDRDGREHLRAHTRLVALPQPYGLVEAVRVHLAEDLAIAEHAGAAARAVLELHPPSGAIPLLEVGPVRWQDVGVDVDGHRSTTAWASWT